MQYSRRIVIAAIALIGAFGISPNASSQEPLKVVIIGLVHGHANGLLRSDYQNSLNVVGIHETNPIAIKKYRDRYDLDENMFVSDLHTLLDERKPDAAWVFTNTFGINPVLRHLVKYSITTRPKPILQGLCYARPLATTSRRTFLKKSGNLLVCRQRPTGCFLSLAVVKPVAVALTPL